MPLKINLRRGFQNISGNLTIFRTVAGLSLPIRCFLGSGAFFGSCNYNDLCQGWKDMWGITINSTSTFAPPYIENLQCPYNIPAQLIDTANTYDVPDFAQHAFLSFMGTGDFDVKIRATDDVGFFGCINLKFTMKKQY
jgi:hypothetical protein